MDKNSEVKFTMETTAQADLARTREFLLAIARITIPVIGSRPLREQIQELLEQVCMAYDLEAGVLRILNGDSLDLVAVHGIPYEQVAVSMPANVGLAVRLIEDGKPIAVEDVSVDSQTSTLADRARVDPRKFIFTSYAGAPLIMEGRTVGILGLYSIIKKRAFTELELKNLQILANHIAICMANEKLYETLAGKQAELEAEIRCRDKTERERVLLEEQLRHAQKMEALGQLAGGVAHDFNNMLTVILGNAAILLNGLQKVTGSHQMMDTVSQIRQAGEHASDLTRRLLAFSRRQPTKSSVFDLALLVRKTEAMLSRLVRADIQLELECDTQPCMVKADAGQIQQVLLNLVLNASDAIQKTGRITVWCKQEQDGEQAKSPDRWCVLGVRDTGTGMTAEIRDRIFEPFFTTKPVGRGTGLGLSMVYGIVTQMGGRIEVDTDVGHGTTCRVYLPWCNETLMTAVPSSAEAVHRSGDGLILLCEDDDAVRGMLGGMLRGAGYDVLEASDGAEALSLSFDKRKPDLLITDIIMPGMRGNELARQMQQRQPGLKVLFISGYMGDDSVWNDIPDHADFLQKPFMPQDLLTKVREKLIASP